MLRMGGNPEILVPCANWELRHARRGACPPRGCRLCLALCVWEDGNESIPVTTPTILWERRSEGGLSEAAVAAEGRASGRDAASRRGLSALTGLRFFAAMFVFLFHYGAGFSERLGFPAAVTTLLRNGHMGVSFFFVLSGFILTYSYDRRLNSRADLWDFAVARFARIYPVYLLALVVSLPLLLASSHDWVTSLRVLLMVQSWGPAYSPVAGAWVTPAWTLSVEAFFYLCFPALLWWTAGMSRRQVMGLLGICAAIIITFTVSIIRETATFAPGLAGQLLSVPLVLFRLPEFFLGVLLCRLHLLTPVPAKPAAWGPSVTAVLLLALFALTANPYALSAASVLLGLLVFQLARSEGSLARLLSTRWMLALGGASYSLYLLQTGFKEGMRTLAEGRFASIEPLVSPLVLIVISLLVFLCYEEPARRWLRRRLSKH